VRKIERGQPARAMAGSHGTATASGASGTGGSSMSDGGRRTLAQDRRQTQSDSYGDLWGTGR
jgi:hypothetical protein